MWTGDGKKEFNTSRFDNWRFTGDQFPDTLLSILQAHTVFFDIKSK